MACNVATSVQYASTAALLLQCCLLPSITALFVYILTSFSSNNKNNNNMCTHSKNVYICIFGSYLTTEGCTKGMQQQ